MTSMMKRVTTVLSIGACLFLSACAHNSIEQPLDPLEPLNRKIFVFNDHLDSMVLRPIAVHYKTYTPEIAQRGVSNFFINLSYPKVIINDFLQGKIKQGGADTGRFLLNSTIGLLGFIDVGSKLGLTINNEDFGQTFGVWGIGEGWYLVLPLFGPSSNRDALGLVLDTSLNLVTYSPTDWRLALTTFNFVQIRSQLLGVDNVLDNALDPYAFLRSHYLQRRQSAIKDGITSGEGSDSDADFDFEEYN